MPKFIQWPLSAVALEEILKKGTKAEYFSEATFCFVADALEIGGKVRTLYQAMEKAKTETEFEETKVEFLKALMHIYTVGKDIAKCSTKAARATRRLTYKPQVSSTATK